MAVSDGGSGSARPPEPGRPVAAFAVVSLEIALVAVLAAAGIVGLRCLNADRTGMR